MVNDSTPIEIENLEKYGVHLMTWDHFYESADNYRELGPALSNELIHFFCEYIKSFSAKNMLFCEPLSGVLPAAFIKEGSVDEITCLGWEKEPYAKALWLTKGLPVKWNLGNLQMNLRALDEEFDVIFYFNNYLNKPVGWSSSNKKSSKGINYRVRTHDLILNLLSKLKSDGEGIFILPNTILWDKDMKFIELIVSNGFYIHSIMEIFPDFHKPSYTSPLSAFFISKLKFQKANIINYELSSLDPIHEENSNLMESILEHRSGIPDYGNENLEPRDFRYYDLYFSTLGLDFKSRESGSKLFLLRQIAKEISKGDNRQPIGGFIENQNCIYIPSIGNSPVVTRISDLKIKPQNYYQVVLDEKQAYSEYIARYFNTSLGQKIRRDLGSWGVIPHIPQYNLMVAPVLLPSINKQIELINLLNDIQNIKINLDAQENMLWMYPKKVESIRREIRKFDRSADELLNEWIESLPFPLASILRKYKSDSEPRNKVEHLLHFFEAYAQFNTTLLLSAYYQADKYFQNNKNDWIDPDNDFCRSKRASFGNWVTIGERVSKFTRSQLSNKDNRLGIFDLFHTKDEYFINQISSKELYKIFRNANTYRNDWSGHGGVSSDTLVKRRLALLETELTAVRELVKDSYINFLLIQPKQMTMSRDIFQNVVKSLVGSNSLFPEITLETNIGLDVNELYFVEKSSRDPLKLIRFFRMLPSPQSEQNACYFYSRFNPQGIRYISYHFETQSEQEVEDEGLVEFFNRLSN